MHRSIFRIPFALSFILVGILHFSSPEPFVSIMPSYLPSHLELVYLSGFFEILGGCGLLIPRVRRWSAWGLIALLVAVFPANINMLVNDIYLEGMPRERWLLWLRLPLQFALAWVVLWCGEIWPRGSK